MSPTATDTSDIDRASLRRDAEAEVSKLREQIRRMAPEARDDPGVRVERDDCRSQLEAAEAEVCRIDEEGDELGIREEESQERAEHEHREALQGQIAKLDGECRTLAGACDKKLQAAAEAIKAYVDVFARRQSTRTALQNSRGERSVGGGGPAPLLERALLFHLIESGPGRVIRLNSQGSGDLRPLSGFERAPDPKKGK